MPQTHIVARDGNYITINREMSPEEIEHTRRVIGGCQEAWWNPEHCPDCKRDEEERIKVNMGSS